jgi:hypothetical protein
MSISPFELTRPKVAIIGLHDATRDKAPWDDPSWEVWAANEYAGPQFKGFIKHYERWLQIHTEDIFRRTGNWNDRDHLKWLQEFPTDKPLYMQKHYNDIPASVRFPLEEIKQRFGLDARTTFFGCTAAHSLSLALYLGAKTVGMWGVEANSQTEYGNERDSLSFWLGVAKGMGVEIVLPAECTLLGTGRAVYGYEGLTGIRAKTLQARLEVHTKATEEGAVKLTEAIEIRRLALEATHGPKNSSASKAVWDAHLKTMDALARVNLARGIQLEDEKLLDMMLSSGMEILTSVLLEQRENQFRHQAESLQAKLNEAMGRRIEVLNNLRTAPSNNEKKRLGKRVMKLDNDVADQLGATNLVQGVVAELVALRRIANGMGDDLKPPIEQLLVRMTINEPDNPPCKNHPDRAGTVHYGKDWKKDGYSLCTECAVLKDAQEVRDGPRD